MDVGDRCQFNGCGKSAVWLNPDGERQTLLVLEPFDHRLVGPEHWLAADPLGERVWRQALAQWPGFPTGWTRVEPTPEEARRLSTEQKMFQHALTYEPPARRGGLVRADNSGLVDPGRGW